ncbi:hypothetical protein [Alkaliphilus sp. B6464]|uniref:hypothetical protein n=1 Tax=Alkaliphilus sp. B6464 TaxID=2731219 RepID=UPI001BA67C55|nr:hypothetical protein [Alkaliphilus sp. B6464]QUH21825.1 hypothetical protein HYG84_17975 [Alkaliphilus sp. B6464]
MGNFKMVVSENIGGKSIKHFGSVGTIIEVKNGVFVDREGWKWDASDSDENEGKKFNDIVDVQDLFYESVLYDFKTKFELVLENDEDKSALKTLRLSLEEEEKEEEIRERVWKLVLEIGEGAVIKALKQLKII